MAEGVRLRHGQLRSVMYVVESARKYKAPLLCSHCGTTHEQKTYHLRLDAHGEVVVSPEIWESLKKNVPAEGQRGVRAGLSAVGTEKKPEPIILGFGGTAQPFQVVEANHNGREFGNG